MAETRRYRRYPAGFKQQVVGRMKSSENISALSRELGIDRSMLYLWSRQVEGLPSYGGERQEMPDRREQQLRELEAKVGELEGALGRKSQEVDFFEVALRTIGEMRRNRSGSGETESTNPSVAGSKRKAS